MFQDPRIFLIGSVNSSLKTLEKLIEHDLSIVGVLGLDPVVSRNVSGFIDLQPLADAHEIPFQYFSRLNSPDTINFIKSSNVDFLFLIGLSQMANKELISIPRCATIGYHPTKLPEGRGRGAIPWLIFGKAPAAATFFQIDEGMDSGAVWVQETIEISEEDYAQDVINKLVITIGKALDSVLPDLKKGIFVVKKQNHTKATYLGKRNPEDGLIDWNKSASEICMLIRAVSKPFPGAYTYLGDKKIIVYKASVSHEKNFTGVQGRILKNSKNGVLVQAGYGLLNIEEIDGMNLEDLKTGKKLGFDFENNYFNLVEVIKSLKNERN